MPACLEIGETALRDFDLTREILALRRVAERLGEQKIFVTALVELRLADVEGLIDDADLVLDAGQLVG